MAAVLIASVQPEVKIDLVRVGGTEIGGDPGARVLERHRRLVGEAVDAALDVGAGGGLELPQRLGGGPADLPGGGIVEVVERCRLGGEDRELVADAAHGAASA